MPVDKMPAYISENIMSVDEMPVYKMSVEKMSSCHVKKIEGTVKSI